MKKLIVFVSLLFLIGCTSNNSKSKDPNILIILTDDQGWGDITSHGNKVIETPTMDKLAKSGANFTHFFVSPVCAPTRSSLLTGKYFLSTGVSGVTKGKEIMRSEEYTLAEMLKDNGYKTGCFGKWHNGAHYPNNPQGQGFDYFVGFTAGHWNNYFNTTLEYNGTYKKTNGYINDVLTDEAIHFIDSNKENKFFTYLAYNTPHSPFQVPDKYFNKYKSKGLSNELACVYGMCESLDDNIARILNKLKKDGLLENTLIFFMGDNGPNTDRYNGGMKERKASTHEGGVRVPGVISWPAKIKAGKIIEKNAAHIDVVPTIADILGIKLKNKVDGISLKNVLLDDNVTIPSRNLYQHWAGKGAVRTDTFRYVLNLNGSEELYNMVADPGEKHNIASDRIDVFNKLKKDYKNWYARVTEKGLTPPPIPIGYSEYPVTEIQAIEGTIWGNLKYYEGHGWANDWVTNWEKRSDYLTFNLNIINDGEFKVELKYTLPKNEIGRKVNIQIGEKIISKQINDEYTPQHIPSPDRVKRQEVYEQTWGRVVLGNVKLSKGNQILKLSISGNYRESKCEVKSIIITRIK